MTERGPELFAKIGEAVLRTVVTDFYSRLFGDVMIGFMFEGKNRQHLIDREVEFTAGFLGGNMTYTGRPMRVAHAATPIFGGHFERRLEILRQTLRDHAVDPDVQKVWIDHTLALRSQITPDKGSECATTSVTDATVTIAKPAPSPEARIKLGRRTK
jgi:hemoglobin